METVNEYKGLSGQQWLKLVGDNDSIIDYKGSKLSVVPMLMEFSNQGVSSNVYDATHVCISSQYDNLSTIVNINRG